jgi:hypothetical protein
MNIDQQHSIEERFGSLALEWMPATRAVKLIRLKRVRGHQFRAARCGAGATRPTIDADVITCRFVTTQSAPKAS